MVEANGISIGGIVAINGSAATVPITNMANAQTITVTLFDVHQGASVGDVAVQMSVLVGEITGNGLVNAPTSLTRSC